MNKGSSKPKGATSHKETAFGIIPRSQLLRLEIKGVKKGLEHVGRSYLHQSISPIYILKLHNISFGWIFPDWAGKYRTIRVEYSGKEAPAFSQVETLVVNLCADLEERLKHLDIEEADEVITLIAWFQHRFVQIHPFQDYNGRLARMLTTFTLLKLNIPPFEIKANTDKDRKKYLQAMYDADESDMSSLETLVRQAFDESISKVIADQ